MEFGLEKCAMLVMDCGKRQITNERELKNKEESEHLERKKLQIIKNLWEYWKRTQEEMKEKKKKEKSNSEERENIS